MDQADKLNNIFYGSSRAHGSFLPDNITNGQKTQGKAKTIKIMLIEKIFAKFSSQAIYKIFK